MFNQCHPKGRKMRFEMPFGKFGFPPPPFIAGLRRPKYNVPLNVVENESDYEVKVFATNFSKDEITIKVIDDLLYVSGKKEFDEENSPNFVLQEFPIKNFERILALNGKVNTENISARSENEVLIITLPKSAESLNKGVTIEVK
jgi:HSP20 family protein